MPTLDRITVYPIKSFDGHDLQTCEVLTSGALAEDRRYALVDEAGKYVNGKNCQAIHKIRAEFQDNLQRVTLSFNGRQDSFDIAAEKDRLVTWCSEVLERRCQLVENAQAGFPDDTDSSGPTLVSTATLEAIATWFEGISPEEVRRRFRFNFEVGNVPAFWEDGLVPEQGEVRCFEIGDIVWQGRGICQRCVVPTRDSRDGIVTVSFARKFSQQRQALLPDWAPASRFDHFYRLGVNTGLVSGNNGVKLQLGDELKGC